jgi:hypothetical protein
LVGPDESRLRECLTAVRESWRWFGMQIISTPTGVKMNTADNAHKLSPSDHLPHQLPHTSCEVSINAA